MWGERRKTWLEGDLSHPALPQTLKGLDGAFSRSCPTTFTGSIGLNMAGIRHLKTR
ncbi:hypothetical protein [Sporosarcina sp. SG10008]|uniref:hypothetical protein n=1 Tax=Sporosarcina sp. SG10008 TaxID=3373103 RepID=UPI0037DD2B97